MKMNNHPHADTNIIHDDVTYQVGEVNKPGLIVCTECHPEELQGMNECFCTCHTLIQEHWFCSRCKRFHIPAHQ